MNRNSLHGQKESNRRNIVFKQEEINNWSLCKGQHHLQQMGPCNKKCTKIQIPFDNFTIGSMMLWTEKSTCFNTRGNKMKQYHDLSNTIQLEKREGNTTAIYLVIVFSDPCHFSGLVFLITFIKLFYMPGQHLTYADDKKVPVSRFSLAE